MFFFYDDGDLNITTNEVSIKITDLEHWMEVILPSIWLRHFKGGMICKGKKFKILTTCMQNGKLNIVSFFSYQHLTIDTMNFYRQI